MIVDESADLPRSPDKTAEGHEAALQTLSEVRNRALVSVMDLNARHNSFNNPILPQADGQSAHSRAHSSVLAYHSLLSKPSRINRVDAWDFYQEDFTTAPVPAALVNGTEPIEIEMADMNDSVDQYLNRVRQINVPISLKTVDNWRDENIQLQKTPVMYETYHDPEVVKRKLVLPPATLDDVFRRLDNLADHFGVLISIEQSDQDPYEI